MGIFIVIDGMDGSGKGEMVKFLHNYLFSKDKSYNIFTTREPTNGKYGKKIREMLEFLVKQRILDKVNNLNLSEKKIYELTGDKGQTNIAKLLKVAPNTISHLWKKLEKEGILIKDGKGYRKVV